MVETRKITAEPLIKVIDFGLAKYFSTTQNKKMSSILGTPYYIAPEVIKGSYNEACDMWSIGVIAYCLLAGYPPFNAEKESDLFDKILKCDFKFYDEDWSGISMQAKDFIFQTLEVDAKNRMTPLQALNHPWILKHAPNNFKEIDN